ncbi:hypothetical protein HDU93_006254 [Gonapodya sp. JEL0774]|nr:hypothetical protein HDU93_006254 [Gonapodya sp. JEL0774]
MATLPKVAHAIITKKAGPAAEVLSWEEVAGPELKPGTVVIQIAAASVNPVDFKARAGNIPFVNPPKVGGGDVAGTVVASSVEGFATGDRVFGRLKDWGAHQEYVVHDPSDLGIAKMSPSLSFEEAGGAAICALTAYYLGCDEVIEYDKPEYRDITKLTALKPEWKESFDVIYDTIGNDLFYSPLGSFLLRPKAPYVTAAAPVDGAGAKKVGLLDVAGLMGKLSYRAVFGARPFKMVIPTNNEWGRVAGWINEGKIKVHVQETIPLKDAARAHDLVAAGRVVGKVILVA